MPDFMVELRDNNSLSAKALELTILTAVRTSECLLAKWVEFNDDYSVWIIPKERMKRGIRHRVPLPPSATSLLQELPQRSNTQLLFPGAKRKSALSNMAMLELLRGMRPGLTVHGFRSSFRDWVAAATSFPRELAELALSHSVGSEVETAYFRDDLLEKRRKLMCAWDFFIAGEPYSTKLAD
jgi:integrase